MYSIPAASGCPYNGDPRAQYLLLEQQDKQWTPIFRQVDYDIQRLISAFATSSMRQEIGPEVELHLRTALTGLPWSSDFSYWLLKQPIELQQNSAIALSTYLKLHGPGKWAFQ